MKKWLAVCSTFFSVYLIFVIAFLPASFVISKIKLPANVQVAQVSGSVWHSQVERLLIGKTLVNNININVNWLSILRFNPRVNVTFGGALYNGPEGRFNASGLFSDLTVSDLQLDVRANDIAQQLPLPIPVEAQSSVSIIINEFVVGQPVCQQLSGNVKWGDAAITALSEQVPLGSLKATLSCDKGKGIAILDENNELGVTFTAELGANGAISGNGYLTPDKNLPKAIEQVLPFLGRQDQQGRYRLIF